MAQDNLYKIYVWPDGSWVGEDDQKELEDAMNESDNYVVKQVTEEEFLCYY